MSQPPPLPGTKASRLAVALGRITFWRVWSREASDPTAITYFESRKLHWEHCYNAIQMEP